MPLRHDLLRCYGLRYRLLDHEPRDCGALTEARDMTVIGVNTEKDEEQPDGEQPRDSQRSHGPH
jgi:hypothetical protein